MTPREAGELPSRHHPRSGERSVPPDLLLCLWSGLGRQDMSVPPELLLSFGRGDTARE